MFGRVRVPRSGFRTDFDDDPPNVEFELPDQLLERPPEGLAGDSEPGHQVSNFAIATLMAWLMAHSTAFLMTKLTGPAAMAGAMRASWKRMTPFMTTTRYPQMSQPSEAISQPSLNRTNASTSLSDRDTYAPNASAAGPRLWSWTCWIAVSSSACAPSIVWSSDFKWSANWWRTSSLDCGKSYPKNDIAPTSQSGSVSAMATTRD